MSVLKTNKLTKTFGGVQALSDVTIEVKEGSVTGFLGPNGAGKSTTMNILLGFINATHGEAYIFGKKVGVSSTATRRSVGFLSSNMALDKTLTVAEELEYFGHLNGGYDDKYTKELAKKFDLDLKQKVGYLSTGNHQKVALITALMNKPKLLILDEPTNGLDPLVQAEFNKVILELKKSGSTIFISSHILSEVQELCDEFIFIKQGKVMAQLTKAELGAKSGEVITIKPNASNREKITKLLKSNGINYKLAAGNLEDTFMQYYEDGANA